MGRTEGTVQPGIAPCTGSLCSALTYSMLVANQDGSNVQLIQTSPFQSFTHPRVSGDKNWVLYTTYNDQDSRGCASEFFGYLNTELRAIRLDGSGDKRIVAPVPGQLNSNGYWLGTTREFTYLSGPPAALKFYRTLLDASMNVIGGPTQIPVPGTIVPMDPQAHPASDRIVFPGLYASGGGYVKSIFRMKLSDSSSVEGLSLGRDHAGAVIYCANAACENIMENDPKISPDGTKVAFMRRAPSSGANGFGWHIFVVPVTSLQGEVDISYAHLGSDVMKNDVLPEWIDNATLVISTIEVTSATEIAKNVYTMKADGTQRTKVPLPSGFRYADVYPFTDAGGTRKLVISAEKIGASCAH